jgi:DNA-binding PadR family transcriptional regulator
LHLYVFVAKNKTEEGIEITEGAIYPILHKLEEDGVLEAYIKKIENRKKDLIIYLKNEKPVIMIATDQTNELRAIHKFI